MKRKLLLALSLMALMVCLFAISVSAAEWFGNVEIIDNNGDGVSDISVTDTVPNAITEGELTSESALVKLSCDCQAGSHTFPAYYVCTINRNVRNRCYNLDYSKLNALKSEYCGGTADYSLSNVIAFELPAGYTDADSSMVKNAPSIKYFSFAKCSTATRVGDAYGGHNWLQGTPVEEIDIGPFLTKVPSYFCYNCDSLTSVTIPDQVTEINTLAFYGCDNLTTVKFTKDSGLTTFGAQSFKACKSLGAFYIPKGVTSFGMLGSGTSPIDGCTSLYFVSDPDDTTKSSVYYFPTTVASIVGEAFKGCTGLNDVLVFHEGITSVSDGWAFCGSNTISVVFLGNMEEISTTGNAWNNKITLYFCNENDKSASDISTKTNAIKVFCFGDGNTTHLKELSKETDATCTLPKMVADYCFCGTIMGEPVTEGEALGHSNTIILGYEYENYMDKGICSRKCDRCGNVSGDEIDALFTCLGISAKTFGDDIGLTQGYAINRAAIETYKASSEGFDFGVLAYANVGGTEVAPKPGDDKVVDIVFDNMANDYINVIVTGIPDDFMNSPIVLCLYVKDKGSFFYLNNGTTTETIVGNSYNEIVG